MPFNPEALDPTSKTSLTVQLFNQLSNPEIHLILTGKSLSIPTQPTTKQTGLDPYIFQSYFSKLPNKKEKQK